MGTSSTTRPAMIGTQFEAWLAAPATLAAYEQIIPGSAERILAMAESEQRERLRHKSRELSLALLSRIAVAIMALMVLTIALVMVLRGQSLAGLGTLVAALGTFTSVYLRHQVRSGSKAAP